MALNPASPVSEELPLEAALAALLQPNQTKGTRLHFPMPAHKSHLLRFKAYCARKPEHQSSQLQATNLSSADETEQQIPFWFTELFPLESYEPGSSSCSSHQASVLKVFPCFLPASQGSEGLTSMFCRFMGPVGHEQVLIHEKSFSPKLLHVSSPSESHMVCQQPRYTQE